MVSLYAFGKWAVAALAIVGWCYWAIPAIFREAGNPELTLRARRQILLLALICLVPPLATVWVVSSSDEEASAPAPPARTPPAEPRLPSVADTSASLTSMAESGSATAVGASRHRAPPLGPVRDR